MLIPFSTRISNYSYSLFLTSCLVNHPRNFKRAMTSLPRVLWILLRCMFQLIHTPYRIYSMQIEIIAAVRFVRVRNSHSSANSKKTIKQPAVYHPIGQRRSHFLSKVVIHRIGHLIQCRPRVRMGSCRRNSYFHQSCQNAECSKSKNWHEGNSNGVYAPNKRMRANEQELKQGPSRDLKREVS